MPTYTYHCPAHGDFDLTVWGVAVVGVPDYAPCPKITERGRNAGKSCYYHRCKRVLTLPAAVIVEGGTGARRGG